jgi:hypothetical protein
MIALSLSRAPLTTTLELREAGGGPCRAACQPGEKIMLETLAIVLILLWLLGLVSSYTIGGFIHILLVIAIIVILLRVVQGRRL